MPDLHPSKERSRYSVAVEFFVYAESRQDAEAVVGESMGNFPDEIEDFIVQPAEESPE